MKSLEKVGYLTNHDFTSVIFTGMPLRDVVIDACFLSAVLPAPRDEEQLLLREGSLVRWRRQIDTRIYLRCGVSQLHGRDIGSVVVQCPACVVASGMLYKIVVETQYAVDPLCVGAVCVIAPVPFHAISFARNMVPA